MVAPVSPKLNLQDEAYHLKRRVLWVGLPLGFVAAVVGWVATDFGADGDLYSRVSPPLFALSLAVYFLALVFGGRVGLRLAELSVFWSTSLLVVFNLYFNLISGGEGRGLAHRPVDGGGATGFGGAVCGATGLGLGGIAAADTGRDVVRC